MQREEHKEQALQAPERSPEGRWPLLWTRPFTYMRQLADEMDRIFDEFGRRPDWFRTALPERAGTIEWRPDVELLERDGKLLVRADLPGLNKEDVKVEISQNELTVQGERRQEAEERGKGFYRTERSYGGFYRCLALPEGAETDKATAVFRNGVLEIEIPVPRIEAPRGRRLEIHEAPEKARAA